MLIHYLRSAAQALLKHRKHSILNIIGFSLALSQTMARALFSDEDPIGKSVTIEGGYYFYFFIA